MTNIPTEQQAKEVNRIIYWSVGVLALVSVLGMLIWSQAGIAVFFDRITGMIAGCF